MKILHQTKIEKARKSLMTKASGNVLEIGSGTGANFPLYQKATHITAIEPDAMMRERSIERQKLTSIPIKVHDAVAESLPFSNQIFDTVVSTLVFCSVNDPEQSLQEIKRVSKPNATILFLEHVEMKQPFMAKLQHFATPVWRRLADGCHLNRNTLQFIKHSGLTINQIDEYFQGLFISVMCKNDHI